MSNITKTNNSVNSAITFDNEKLNLIREQFFPKNTSEVEMQYCLSVAKQYGLDPILKQIFFLKRRSQDKTTGLWTDKVEPLVGRDGFLTIAHKTDCFGGIESICEVKSIPVLSNGEWTTIQDLVATCKVYRKDSSHPFVAEVAYTEYVQKSKDGKVTSFWADKPQTMLKKVAESQALRKAFNISGIFTPEEVGLSENENEVIIDTDGTNNQAISQEIETPALNFIEVRKNFMLLGVILDIDNDYVRASGNTTANHKALKDIGFVYKNTQWVCPVSNFIPASLKGADVVSKLENLDIDYESKIKNQALWLKVDNANSAIIEKISNLGFSQASGKDFYALKIA